MATPPEAVGWPGDHPARTDPALAPWAQGLHEVCPGSRVLRTLRHVPGRRVAAQVRTGAGDVAVAKVFARPRARGNDRRLRALAGSHAGAVLPRPIGADRHGHVLVVGFTPGTPMNDLDDSGYLLAAGLAGQALRHLHDCRVTLDRTWTLHDEVRQLLATCGPVTTGPARAFLAGSGRAAAARGEHDVVCSHRDFHPQQVVLQDGGTVGLIDLDDAANAPRALDTGNFTAHLQLDAIQGRRTEQVAVDAVSRFLGGYGGAGTAHTWWEELSLLRLAALAETRKMDAYARAAVLERLS